MMNEKTKQIAVRWLRESMIHFSACTKPACSLCDELANVIESVAPPGEMRRIRQILWETTRLTEVERWDNPDFLT